MASIVYIDETGSVGAKIGKHPFLQLVAVLVDEDRVRVLSQALRGVAVEHLGSLPADFEFHGNELWAGVGHWTGKTPPELLAAYEDAISLLDSLGLSVAHATIDRRKLHERYNGAADANAYRLALQFMLEKIDRLPGKKIVVADESKEQELSAIKMLSELQEWGGGEVPGRMLQTVIDSLHFVRSHNSPGVQMADLCAYLLHRQRLTPTEKHENATAGRARMLDTIRSCTPTYRQPWPS